MISIIQIYIHCMKGVEVQIIPNIPKDLPLLLKAYDIANDWINQNIKTIIILDT